MKTKYVVTMKRRVERRAAKMPVRERELLTELIDDLEDFGPVQPGWKNYSVLSATEYHCHLSYHWVACWRLPLPPEARETVQLDQAAGQETDGDQTEREEKIIEIEVYYAGSREDAPY